MTKEEAIEHLKLIRLNAGMTGSKSFKEALDLAIVSLSQPSLPSGLDEAAEEYVNDYGYTEDDYKRERIIAEEHFKAGAEWMAGQGVKIGETKIYLEDDGDEPLYSQKWLDLESTEFKIPDGAFEDGDGVDIILRKK